MGKGYRKWWRGHREWGEVIETGEKSQRMGRGHRKYGEVTENRERSQRIVRGHIKWGGHQKITKSNSEP